MASIRSWTIPMEDKQYFLEYFGPTPDSGVRLAINYEQITYPMSTNENGVFFTVVKLGNFEFVLQLNADGSDAVLSQAGNVINPDVPSAAASAVAATNDAKLDKKIKNGMSTFLTVVVLSIVNIFLIAINAEISFLFSLESSSTVYILGQVFSAESGQPIFFIIGLILAILIIGAFGGLYILARKYNWAIWLAFGVIILDTVLLLGMTLLFNDLEGWGGSAINMIFHLYLVYSMLKLGLDRGKKVRAEAEVRRLNAMAQT